MAARPIWKGHLRLSLVSIPIRVYPATNPAATVRFHQLHRDCQTRIEYKKWCPHCQREVNKDEIVRGYEFERGRYVAIEDKEIEKVRPESTRVINLMQFTEASAVDAIFIDEPYYLAPDGQLAAESFAVMREALQGKAGIGTVAFHGRERLVAVEPRETGLVMYTLRHENEIRDLGAIPELHELPKKVRADEVTLARKVMGGFESKIDFSKYRDTYEDALRELIKAKIAGEEVITPREEAQPKVVNLMDALRKSLDRVSTEKKRPARATAKRVRRAAAPRRKAS